MPSSDFRVPNQMLVNNSLIALQQSFSKLADLQDQASSLKRLSQAVRRARRRRVGDAAARRARSQRPVHAQPQRRAGLARQRRQRAHDRRHATAEGERPRRAGVERVDSTPTPRQGIATQIDSIRQSLIGVANTQYAGRPIFAGTASGDAAYDASGQYVGVSSAVERNIAPGQRIQVNVNGDTVFGPPGTDLFTTLAQISQAVTERPEPADHPPDHAGHPDDTRSRTQLAQVGSQFLRVQNMQSQNTSNGLTMKQNLSSIEDADIAAGDGELQAQQVAYQAALSATARAIQPSLTDFLK